MLHIRVVTPPGRTGLLLDRLRDLPGIRNLVVLEGAARDPHGDAVFFDVDYGAANPVFRALRGLGLDHDGAITVEQVDAALTDSAGTDGVIGSPVRELAPVWEMVEATIRGGAAYSPSFFLLLAIAGLIGAVGILTNSQILIVGAMVVGPEYGAIIAVALGISKGNRAAVRDGLLALVAGFSAAIALTLAFGVAVRAAGKVPVLFLHGVRPVSALIDSPNLFSVVVAILAGIVGVVALTQSRSGALVGVFISVTTIPAAADIGLSAAVGSWHEAGGSALQLLLNVVLLIVVGAGGLSAQRVIWRRLGARRRLSPGGGMNPRSQPGPLRHFADRLDKLRSADVVDMHQVGRVLVDLAADEEFFVPLIAQLPVGSAGSRWLIRPERGPRLVLVHRPEGVMGYTHSHRCWVGIAPVRGVETHQRWDVAGKVTGMADLRLADERALVQGDVATLVPPRDVHNHGHVVGSGPSPYSLILLGDDMLLFDREEYDPEAGTWRALAPGDPGRDNR